MTFPTPIEIGTGTGNGLSTSVAIPGTALPGDLMIITQNFRNTGNFIVPAGWTILLPVAAMSDSTNATVTICRVLDGTESSPIVIYNQVFGSGGTWSGDYAWIRYIIRNGGEAEASSYATGVTNPPSFSPSWGADDTLWIALTGYIHNPTVTGYPASYGNHVNPVAGDTGMGGATRSLNAATENPGAFTLSGDQSPREWAATIAVHPAIPPPVAAFSGTPLVGNAPLSVAFTDLSTQLPTSWAWDFGDFGSSTSQNPTHVYTQPGIYTVTLTATNAYGSDSETKIDYVVVSRLTAGDSILSFHEAYA